ncbi:NAD(P)-dependent malic enzyme [Membranihabitans marinus]|uniref:NAD(P)-dependent malic enzyme n=1 Tax=Membranihabitans marinus TaxID=1227546 RepID=UPI0021D47D94|nr:NADP-dependent malic enzyme [Membranihabitans marinus]
MIDLFSEALILHKRLRGKINIIPKVEVRNINDLSLVYSPGVAEPCKEIARDPELAYQYTIKGNTVAIVSDGTAVLGLGDIGPLAAMPVMEGKAILFKRFANINAFPICLDTTDVDEIVQTIRNIAPAFGGINLEDISAPRSFIIEQRLQDLGIPVFHDDQHGTAIVVLAGLYNAAKVVGKDVKDLKVVINGAGAAGIAIAKMLRCVDHMNQEACIPVKQITVCDSKGIIHRDRKNLNFAKKELLGFTNFDNQVGSLKDALVNADVFIGVSKGDLLKAKDIETMATDPIIFGLANPTPEIMPEEAYKGGAAIVATGRSDLPNQVNNVLGFPGIFRGAMEARAPKITTAMKLAAVHAIAECIKFPTVSEIIPSTLNDRVAYKVAEAVKAQAIKDFGEHKYAEGI